MENEWIDIFKTGKHTSSSGDLRQWTENDLDEVISNFGKSGDQDEVPIVIGHPKTDSPAWGWVSKVRRSENKLQVQFRNLVKEFVDGVKEKKWPNRSIRIAPTEKGWKLIHVGFLGATPPAVKGLTPIFSNKIESYQDYTMPNDDQNTTEVVELQNQKEFVELQKEISQLKIEIEEEKRNRKIQQFNVELASYPNLQTEDIAGLADFMASLEKADQLKFFRQFLKTLPADHPNYLFSEISKENNDVPNKNPLAEAVDNLISSEFGEK